MDASASRSLNLLDMPPECTWHIVQSLEHVSDSKHPLCRSLLRWAQASTGTQQQLVAWVERHANPVDHAPKAFTEALASIPPMPMTLITAKKFAQYLSSDLLCKISFSEGKPERSDLEKMALSLMAINAAGDRLPPGEKEKFLQALTATLIPQQGRRFDISHSAAEMVIFFISSIFDACGFGGSSERASGQPFAAECMAALLSLPPSLKSVAIHEIFNRRHISLTKEFGKLFIQSAHLFLPQYWDDEFMGSIFGFAILQSCDAFLKIYGAVSEKFIVAHAGLMGSYIAGLPKQQRDFRTLCQGLYRGDPYDATFDDSDDEDLSSEQRQNKKVLDQIFLAMRKGQVSDVCREAFVANFVSHGLLTREEFDFLMIELSIPAFRIRNFADVALKMESVGSLRNKQPEDAGGNCPVS